MLEQLKAVWTYRYFWLSLVKMDLMTRYRRSVLGIGWSLLHPLGMTAVFCLVFSQFVNEGWRGYAQSTLAAMAVWEFLRNCMVNGCRALTQNEAYIRQAPLPYGIYPLRTMLSLLFHLVISLTLLLVMVWVLNGPLQGDSPGDPSGNPAAVFLRAWTLIPVVILLAAFGWAIATITAFATSYFHDIGHMLEVGTQLLFFLSPIIWRPDMSNPSVLRAVVNGYNPIAWFVELVRRPLVDGIILNPNPSVGADWTYFPALGQAALLTAVTVAAAVATIGLLQKKVIFHL